MSSTDQSTLHEFDEIDETMQSIEQQHPFTVFAAIIAGHIAEGSIAPQGEELFERIVQLAVRSVQNILSPEVLAQVKEEIPSMLAEQPDLDETDLWMSFIHMDMSMMPDLLLLMANTMISITSDITFDDEEKMYQELQGYVAVYKEMSDELQPQPE